MRDFPVSPHLQFSKLILIKRSESKKHQRKKRTKQRRKCSLSFQLWCEWAFEGTFTASKSERESENHFLDISDQSI